jgi:hypothetical protein
MRTGGNEVYYKRNPNGNTGLEERRPEDEAGRTAGRNGPNPDMDVDRTGWLYDAAGRRRPPGRLPAGVYLAVGRVRIVVHGP